ncbi:unnamed protein product [Cercospora beticola]|nr:unnamed protein product [Cercospora beticola]
MEIGDAMQVGQGRGLVEGIGGVVPLASCQSVPGSSSRNATATAFLTRRPPARQIRRVGSTTTYQRRSRMWWPMPAGFILEPNTQLPNCEAVGGGCSHDPAAARRGLPFFSLHCGQATSSPAHAPTRPTAANTHSTVQYSTSPLRAAAAAV